MCESNLGEIPIQLNAGLLAYSVREWQLCIVSE